MISLIQGTIISKRNNTITLLTKAGIGYEVHVSAPFFLELAAGAQTELHTYLKVSENALEMFGFKTIVEKEFFELLITVNGVGPKTAINIMGLGSLGRIQEAISRNDVAYLTQVSGIGRKTAERLCVELKNKAGQSLSQESQGASDALGEVVEALVGMGYSREEAREAVKKVDASKSTTEDILRQALKYFK